MNRIIVKSKVGGDGTVRVVVPVGMEEADQEVQVIVEPIASISPMSPTEWAEWVRAMAGSIADSSFQRHEQGEYERREAFP